MEAPYLAPALPVPCVVSASPAHSGCCCSFWALLLLCCNRKKKPKKQQHNGLFLPPLSCPFIREPLQTRGSTSGPCSCSSLRCGARHPTGTTPSPSAWPRFTTRRSGTPRAGAAERFLLGGAVLLCFLPPRGTGTALGSQLLHLSLRALGPGFGHVRIFIYLFIFPNACRSFKELVWDHSQLPPPLSSFCLYGLPLALTPALSSAGGFETPPPCPWLPGLWLLYLEAACWELRE